MQRISGVATGRAIGFLFPLVLVKTGPEFAAKLMSSSGGGGYEGMGSMGLRRMHEISKHDDPFFAHKEFFN